MCVPVLNHFHGRQPCQQQRNHYIYRYYDHDLFSVTPQPVSQLSKPLFDLYCRMLHVTMKKVLRETQTLRAGCSKAGPKIFAPPQTPFLVVRDGQNLITSLVRIDAILSYRGNRPQSLSLPLRTP